MKKVLIIVTVLSCALLAVTPTRSGSASEGSTAVLNAPAPGFALKDLDGGRHALADYRGRIAVVTFLAAKCPVSNDYNKRVQALAEEFSSRGVAFLAINANSDETIDVIRSHAQANGFKFPILKDETGAVAKSYAAMRTPEAYVIDAKGLLRYHGRIDNSRNLDGVRRRDLSEAINELLTGKTVSVPETKAFGCLIVRDGAAADTGVEQKKAALGVAKVALIKPPGLTKLLQESKGRVLLLNFWATWCGPCVAEFPEFVAFDEKYRSRGLRVVGISADEVGDLQSKVVPFVKEKNVRFEIFVQDVEDPQTMIDLIDKKWEGALPATFVYDRTGKLSFVRYGIIDREQMTLIIEKALKN